MKDIFVRENNINNELDGEKIQVFILKLYEIKFYFREGLVEILESRIYKRNRQ